MDYFHIIWTFLKSESSDGIDFQLHIRNLSGFIKIIFVRVFKDERKAWAWNDMRVSKWQNFLFGWINPLRMSEKSSKFGRYSTTSSDYKFVNMSYSI